MHDATVLWCTNGFIRLPHGEFITNSYITTGRINKRLLKNSKNYSCDRSNCNIHPPVYPTLNIYGHKFARFY